MCNTYAASHSSDLPRRQVAVEYIAHQQPVHEESGSLVPFVDALAVLAHQHDLQPAWQQGDNLDHLEGLTRLAATIDLHEAPPGTTSDRGGVGGNEFGHDVLLV